MTVEMTLKSEIVTDESYRRRVKQTQDESNM